MPEVRRCARSLPSTCRSLRTRCAPRTQASCVSRRGGASLDGFRARSTCLPRMIAPSDRSDEACRQRGLGITAMVARASRVRSRTSSPPSTREPSSGRDKCASASDSGWDDSAPSTASAPGSATAADCGFLSPDRCSASLGQIVPGDGDGGACPHGRSSVRHVRLSDRDSAAAPGVPDVPPPCLAADRADATRPRP